MLGVLKKTTQLVVSDTNKLPPVEYFFSKFFCSLIIVSGFMCCFIYFMLIPISGIPTETFTNKAGLFSSPLPLISTPVLPAHMLALLYHPFGSLCSLASGKSHRDEMLVLGKG